MKFWKRNFIIYGSIAVFFVIDQSLKYFFQHAVLPRPTNPQNIFISFWPILNNNLSFNIPVPNWMATLIAIIILSLLIYFSQKGLLPFTKISCLLIISGALSNILDRIFYGGVVDYIHLAFWPTSFNLADLAIIAGIILAIIYWFNNPEAKKPILPI